MKQKRFAPYLMAFFIPFAVCFLICMFQEVYPFGSNCILRVDMYHQYFPFFTEFANKIDSGGSLQYSWNVGLGSDYVSLYAYYLSSPFNLLLLLCPKAYILEFMTLSILIKIGLCGCFFYYYLEKHFALKREKKDPFRIPALVCSSIYALSGFVAAYNWDIMWMDCVALAPLVILGLELLVKEKNPKLYYISLAISIWSNYYLSIMICIFLVLYFLVLFFEQKEHRLATLGRFILYSLLAGGTSAALLLPEMKILSYSGSSGINFPKTIEWYFNLIAELTRAATGVKTYTGNEHWPNLYVGAITLLLFVLYVLNREIAWKKKIPGILAVVFFLVSFSNNILDFIWHGLHFPDSLPGRQSFLFAFVMLVLVFDCLRHWRGILPVHMLTGVAFWIIIYGYAYLTGEAAEVSKPSSLLITVLLMVCYGGLMGLYRASDAQMKPLIIHVTCALVLVELVTNMAMTSFPTNDRNAYMSRKEDYQEAIDDLKNRQGQDLFYRIEDTGRNTKNDSEFYGYSSATQFSSLMNINVSHFYQNVYMEGGKNFYCHNGATPLLSSMLSIKYKTSRYVGQADSVWKDSGTFGSVNVYENQYALPLGYMIPSELDENWDIVETDKIGNINRLGRLLGAKEDLLVPAVVEQEVSGGSTTITVSKEGMYFASYEKCSADTLTVKTSAGKVERYSKTSHRYLFDFGELEANDTVTVENKKNEQISFRVYRWDMDAFEQVYATLSEQPFIIDEAKDTQILGHVEVQQAGRLLLTIPSEDGWTLYVDGKETPIKSFQGTFISVDLDEGTHEIRLQYRTPYLRCGMGISFSCIFIFMVIMMVRKRLHEGKRKKKIVQDV